MTRLSARRINPGSTAFATLWQACGHKPLPTAIMVNAGDCEHCGTWSDVVEISGGEIVCPTCKKPLALASADGDNADTNQGD